MMTEDKDLKNENRLTKMEERLQSIEDTLKAMPKTIIEGVILQVQIIKNEAVEQYRKEAEGKYALKSDIEIVKDTKKFEDAICGVVEKQVGKIFIAKIVVSTGVIIAVMQFIIEKYK
jgi:hypothetical protein